MRPAMEWQFYSICIVSIVSKYINILHDMRDRVQIWVFRAQISGDITRVNHWLHSYLSSCVMCVQFIIVSSHRTKARSIKLPTRPTQKDRGGWPQVRGHKQMSSFSMGDKLYLRRQGSVLQMFFIYVVDRSKIDWIRPCFSWGGPKKVSCVCVLQF